ncbi:hypothetical protein PI124_g19569 [Phytophthora idaei]|nr:hypothetical protein PI124_g19569 [Phytophthora idaei]
MRDQAPYAKPRGELYILLHKQLLQLKAEDFVEVLTPMDAPAGPSRKRRRHAGHKHVQFNDWVTVSGVQKRRQRSCKADAKCFLYPKSRRMYGGLPKTCYQIWYEDFDSGSSIPESLGKRVVLRRSGKVGARKPTCRELLQDQAGDDADNEDEQAVV